MIQTRAVKIYTTVKYLTKNTAKVPLKFLTGDTVAIIMSIPHKNNKNTKILRTKMRAMLTLRDNPVEAGNGGIFDEGKTTDETREEGQ